MRYRLVKKFVRYISFEWFFCASHIFLSMLCVAMRDRIYCAAQHTVSGHSSNASDADGRSPALSSKN